MFIDTKNKNYQTIIVIIKSRNLFLSLSLLLTVMFSFFILIPSLSFFVFGADPGMTPSPLPSSPSQSISPPPAIPPSPPTVDTAIDKLFSIMPKTLPNVEQKTDPKDGDTILSSKTDDGTITVATKVGDKSTSVTFDWNRGYVDGIVFILDENKEGLPPEELRYYLERFLLNDPTSKYIQSKIKHYGEEYVRGASQGMRDALKLADILGTITTPRNK